MLAAALDGGHVAQDLAAGAAAAPLIGMFCRSWSDWIRVLRRLGDQVVVHAVLPVQEEGRRASGSCRSARSAAAAGHVALREAACRPPWCGPRSTSKLRVVERLLDAQVGEPGDLAQLVQQLGRRPAGCPRGSLPSICTSIGAGRPKFRIWRHDVGGQEVEGRRPGNSSGKLAAQRAHVVRGRTVVLRERHQDVGVGGADDAGACCTMVLMPL